MDCEETIRLAGEWIHFCGGEEQVYRSLAKCYAQTLTELEEMTGKRYEKIHFVIEL